MQLSWRQQFTYDRYGNRNFDEAETTTIPKNCFNGSEWEVCEADRKVMNPSVDASNNRLSSTDGYTFDSSGNIIEDAQGRQFTYDAENKQVLVKDQYDSIIGEYVYDGDGKRIKKIVPDTGEVTVFVYGAAGDLVGEYSTEISQTPKVSYTTSDHLGSPRILTDQYGQVISRRDFMAFGEEIHTPERTQNLNYGSDDVRKKFTGYERDNETDLDFAQARYESNILGRFNSADRYTLNTVATGGIPLSLFLAQPQNWNSYTYCRNNPLKFIDQDGEHPLIAAVVIGALVGAVAGIAIEIAKQKIWDGKDKIELGKVKGAAAQGAILGAVAGLTGGAGLGLAAGYQALTFAGANVVGGMTNRAISGDDDWSRPRDILVDAGSGAVGGYIGGIAPTRYANSSISQSAKYAIIRSEATERIIVSSPLPTLAQPLTRPLGTTVMNNINNQLYSGAGSRWFESGARSAGRVATQSSLNFLFNNIETTVYAPDTDVDSPNGKKPTSVPGSSCTGIEDDRGRIGVMCGPVVGTSDLE